MSEDLHLLQKKLNNIQNKFLNIEQAYQDLQTRFEYIDKLYAVSSRFGAVIDFEQLVNLIQELFTKQISANNYTLYRYDFKNNTIALLHQSNAGGNQINLDSNRNAAFIRELADKQKFCYLHDVSASKQHGLQITARGSLLCFPLMADDMHIGGLLLIQRDAVNAFSESEVALLEKITEHIAFALNKTLLYEHTKALSITDSLTGIYNRRHFAQRFEWELQRAKRYSRSVSLMMLDIDHFKHYNDLNGHLKGDLILIQVADILRVQLRKADILARYGGEEFIILLPETTREQAMKVAEKLRSRIEREKFDLADRQPDGKITASLGIASYPDDATDPEALIHLADQALYSAKSRGRNCVVSHVSRDEG